MLGFECMRQLLIEYASLLTNEFHSVNPTYYPHLTFVLGYIIAD